jgi:hypothetical protein
MNPSLTILPCLRYGSWVRNDAAQGRWLAYFYIDKRVIYVILKYVVNKRLEVFSRRVVRCLTFRFFYVESYPARKEGNDGKISNGVYYNFLRKEVVENGKRQSEMVFQPERLWFYHA